MISLKIGDLTFKFPNGWAAAQLDEWSYYRNQFLNLGNNVRMACNKCSAELKCLACQTVKTAGIKGCDILAILSPTTWLIEVKDYRRNLRTKAVGLADEIALKVRDSLAVIFGAKSCANDADEKALAGRAVACTRIRVVLHLEQTPTPSRLFPRAIRPADVLQRLRQLIKAVDPHPVVAEKSDMKNLPWSVN
jgi:hypothetical protein